LFCFGFSHLTVFGNLVGEVSYEGTGVVRILLGTQLPRGKRSELGLESIKVEETLEGDMFWEAGRET